MKIFYLVWGIKRMRSSQGVVHSLDSILLCLYLPPPLSSPLLSVPGLTCISFLQLHLLPFPSSSPPSVLSPFVPPLLIFLCIHSSAFSSFLTSLFLLFSRSLFPSTFLVSPFQGWKECEKLRYLVFAGKGPHIEPLRAAPSNPITWV